MTRKLDRLNSSNSSGIAFQRLWQRNCELSEANFGDLQTQIDDINAALEAAAAADTKARAHMDDLPNVNIEADYTGTIDSSQFPLNISVKRYDGTTNVSSTSTWTAAAEEGDAVFTIGAATGVLNVTAVTTDSVIRIESTRDGLTLRKKQAITVSAGAPPNTGDTTGGSAWTDTTFNVVTSDTMAAISDELTVTVGASGTVTLSAPLTFSPAKSGLSSGSYKAFGIWQWFNSGTSTWTDLGTETESSPDCVATDDPDTGFVRITQQGQLSVSASKAGLTAAANEKFRLRARNATATATVTTSFSGTASAVT